MRQWPHGGKRATQTRRRTIINHTGVKTMSRIEDIKIGDDVKVDGARRGQVVGLPVDRNFPTGCYSIWLTLENAIDQFGPSYITHINGAPVDRDPPAWNGEGLPPVGTECLVRYAGDGIWSKGKVVAYDDTDIWHTAVGLANKNNLRYAPIQTDRERVIEAAEKVTGILPSEGIIALGELYDAGMLRLPEGNND